MEKDEEYIKSIAALGGKVEELVKANNAIDIYQEYFSGRVSRFPSPKGDEEGQGWSVCCFPMSALFTQHRAGQENLTRCKGRSCGVSRCHDDYDLCSKPLDAATCGCRTAPQPADMALGRPGCCEDL